MKWHYLGDIDIRHGGFYWQESGYDDHVYCVRVTPCSDAGGPDNLWHIESGSIYIPQDKPAPLDIIGVEPDKATRFDIAYAWFAYRGMDTDSQTFVRIGKQDEYAGPNGWNPEPDVVLRGNAKLRNYVRREFLA